MELIHGINLGGFLSQCDHTDEHHRTFITKEDIRWISLQGFDHVRLPIDYEVLEDSYGIEKGLGYEIVEDIINAAAENNLNIILDLHKAPGYDFNDAGDAEKNNLFKDPALQNRFLNLWTNIVKHFCHHKNVAFELLNEVVETENTVAWNDLIARSVATIREYTKESPIIYGGILWNSASTLKYLEKPMDENIYFTFHFYEPLIFTHQKAYWVKNMDMETDVSYPASKADYMIQCKKIGDQAGSILETDFEYIDKEFMRSLMQEAINSAKNAGARLYCGEYGVIDQAPLPDTVRWFKDCCSLFNEYNIGSALWNYKEKDFGLIDDHYAPIKEELLKILTER